MHKFPPYIRFKKFHRIPGERKGKKIPLPCKSPRKSNASWLIYRFYGVTFPKWNIFGKERKECVLRASRTKRGEGAPDAWALKASSSHTLGPALATLLISFVPLARTISQNLPSFVENRPESPWNSVMSGDKTFAATPRTGENWREREVKGRTTGEREKGEKRKINVEGGKGACVRFEGMELRIT